ncbi:MAG TPA: efflux RND transporter periplasmic adaptor subunit [Candidatus Ozemobacteraceae bacterium]|nr:efflux RND transporter periplasmic adaptor subunit [Candidatus Ozemobacteraceae bacterium]
MTRIFSDIQLSLWHSRVSALRISFLITFATLVILCRLQPAAAQEGLLVEVTPARSAEISPLLTFPGTVISPHTARVSAEIGGHLEFLAGEPGVPLASGDVLFRLNAENHRLSLDAALAARDIARRQLEFARAGTRAEEISRLQALEQHAAAALSQIRNEKKRLAGLKAGQAISNAQWDDIEFRERMAIHQLEASQQSVQAARRGQTPEQIAIAAAQLDQAQVQVRQAEKALRDTVVRAPFSSVLVQRYREPGENLAPGEPVVRIHRLDPLRVRFFVGESQLSALRSARRLELHIPALSATCSARLVSLTPDCDEVTRRFPCEAEFANPQSLVWPGLSAEIRVQLPSAQGTLIPLSALVDTQSGTGVFLVEQGLARFRPVRELSRTASQLLVEGIAADAIVVSRGALGLRDGAAVQVRSAEIPPATSPDSASPTRR